MSAATVIVPSQSPAGGRLDRLLGSLAAQTVEHETIVIDNDSPGRAVSAACAAYDFAEVVQLDRNAGFSMPMNLGARRASTGILILLNDDCVCDPDFVERLIAPLDPAGGIVMTSGVLRDWRHPELIDSAGMELDRTLLVYDYLNGEPLSALAGAADPIGPSPKAAAFDRDAFLAVGGFDERLFAYWEDVDLALKMLEAGGICRLAPDALGVHEHSATLGSGSRGKNYLTGFGRGYVLRKWGVMTPSRLPGIVARDLVILGGQAAIDRTVSGVGGRIRGWRAARHTHHYPAAIAERGGASPYFRNLQRRLQRRRKLSAPGPG
ncbi:MAG: glycosyltransferase family 2 protein [Solirubrobacterales bacterium]